MKLIFSLVSFALFAFAHSAFAGPSWQVTSFATNYAGGPAIVSAMDTVVASPLGQQFKGLVLIQSHLADGANPATHSMVTLYPSVAAREAFEGKFPGNSNYAAFASAFEKNAQVISSVRYTPRKSWGQIVDTNRYWEVYLFDVSNAKAFTTTLNGFMGTETGKKFPGQLHLFSTAAGGMGAPSHGVTVGFASAAEAETWTDMAEATADWQGMIDSLNKAAKFLGGNMVQTVKQWGPATIESVSVK